MKKRLSVQNLILGWVGSLFSNLSQTLLCMGIAGHSYALMFLIAMSTGVNLISLKYDDYFLGYFLTSKLFLCYAFGMKKVHILISKISNQGFLQFSIEMLLKNSSLPSISHLYPEVPQFKSCVRQIYDNFLAFIFS